MFTVPFTCVTTRSGRPFPEMSSIAVLASHFSSSVMGTLNRCVSFHPPPEAKSAYSSLRKARAFVVCPGSVNGWTAGSRWVMWVDS